MTRARVSGWARSGGSVTPSRSWGWALVLALFRTTLSDRLTVAFELLVSAMLLFLGVRALVRARAEMRRGALPTGTSTGACSTRIAGQAAHVHLGRRAFAVRPLLVGVVHGLAGSGALTALVLAGFDTNLERLAYTVVFGGGSVLGMGLLSGLAGWPLARLLRTPRARAWTSAAAGRAQRDDGPALGLAAPAAAARLGRRPSPAPGRRAARPG